MRNNDWYLVTATKSKGQTNALTAAWGAFGNLCEEPTMTVYIRPQRYTKKLIDDSNSLTLTYFDFAKYGKALGYMGSHSGADDPDKIKEAGLTLTDLNGAPTYEEGRYVFVLKPFFVQQLDPEHVLDQELAKACFPDKDYSYMYISEIVEAYEIIHD